MAGSESVGTPNLENNGSEYQVTVVPPGLV